MDGILAGVGSALAGFFGSPVVQFVIYSILVYLVVLWLASAYWVFRDMQQRTENAILPYLAASLVIVFLPVFPLAIFVYKIIRPHEKIGEVYERNLAEEALLAEVDPTDVQPTDVDPPGWVPGRAAQTAGGPAFDENAPLASTVRPSPAPNVLHDLADTAEIDDASAVTAPSWPPPGDRGPIPAPEPRTPAGAYLPPSAVLPPLDLPAPAAPEPESAVGTWANRSTAALSDALESIHVTADASRRAVAAGAGLGTVGFLLPWVNTLPGANPLAGYLDRWGLAGPGTWLVFAGLLALTAIAGSSGRTASWQVGLASVATAAFLVGLIWPYVVGGFGRSIGIWVVLVGAAVLAVGGILDRRSRHDRGDATV